jgi:hypothetical protein
MRTINSFNEYKEEVKNQMLFVRYSSVIESGDAKSYNHQTGQVEAGLSVNNATVEFAPNSEIWIAKQLVEYRYLTMGQPESKCWILTGDIVGRGSDNEPLVQNVQPVAIIGESVLDEARALIESDRTAKIIEAIEKIKEGDWYWNPTGKEMTNDEIVNTVHRKLHGVWAEDVREVLQ